MPRKKNPKARRKHRLIVEFTTSHTLTEGDSTHALQMLIDDRLDLQKAPIWVSMPEIYGEKITVKRFSRVMQGEGQKTRGRKSKVVKRRAKRY